MSAWKIITQPTEEPVSLAEAKLHVKQDDDADDDAIASLIVAARRHCERVLGQQLCTATIELYLDRFPTGTIELPQPPLVSIASVKYYDSDNVLITMSEAAYDVDAASLPGRLAPAYGHYWPTVWKRFNAVTIRYVAGYGDAAAVPENIKHAMKLLIGHWYINREAVVVGSINGKTQLAVDALLAGEWHGSVGYEGHGS